ncbi:MAG: hypothetical protein ACYDGR_00265 [Candidatus Dormibacteria bacterium]
MESVGKRRWVYGVLWLAAAIAAPLLAPLLVLPILAGAVAWGLTIGKSSVTSSMIVLAVMGVAFLIEVFFVSAPRSPTFVHH